MGRIREILRNEYIGAIASGFLLAQAMGGFIGAIVQPVVTYLGNRNRPGMAAAHIFNWPQTVVTLTSAGLHLLAALLLLLFVYSGQNSSSSVAAGATATSRGKK